MPFNNSHISIGRVEFHRDRRYPVPPLVVRISERSDLALAAGDGVEGNPHMSGMNGSCSFVGEIIWSRGERGVVGVKFTVLAPNAVNLLDGWSHR